MSPSKPYPKAQVQIRFKDLDKDRVSVEKIMLAAANKFNLYDNTETSRVPQTIRSIVEAKGFGFGLGARVVEGFIIVEFFRHKSESPIFNAIRDFILMELESTFHTKLELILETDPRYRKTH